MAGVTPTWPEVITAKNENRHELVLCGAAFARKIEDEGGLDPAIFTIEGLNYLNISEAGLQILSVDVSKLKNMTNLVLHTNKLKELPQSLCQLEKLKMLDVSRNELTEIPSEIEKLTQLMTLNLASNKLTALPSFKNNVKLSILNVSLNELEDFPDICHPELVHLAEVKLQGNKITDISHNISNLPSLKLLDCSDNKISIVPGELSDISKLKDIVLKGNKLKDNRLMKLVDQCKPKQVLDYIAKNGVRNKGDAAPAAGGGGGGKKGKKGKNKHPEPDITELVSALSHKMRVLHVSETGPKVIAEEESIKLVRPHIVCCVIRGINFTPESFRSFIQLQTRLHDTVCSKRQLATIATHDMAKLTPKALHYMARPPNRLRLVPLGHDKEMTATDLMEQLQAEVEEDRKTHAHSGLHRYLSLLEGKQVYPCLRNSTGKVVSLPPITNSEDTKITESTKDIFVEVTSSNSQGACKTVLHELLVETLQLGIGDDNDTSPNFHSLSVEQVKVVNPEGTLKVVYPSRVDLQVEEAQNITIIRD